MTTTTASQHHLRRVFIEDFSAADIAEPLASFDASTPATDVLAVMTCRAYKVAGIRKDGTICGYVRQEELVQGACGDELRPFEVGDVVADSAGFPELVMRLRSRTGRRHLRILEGRRSVLDIGVTFGRRGPVPE